MGPVARSDALATPVVDLHSSSSQSLGSIITWPHKAPASAITTNYSDTPSITSTDTANMDSESVKKALMKQVLQEANMANARVLIEACPNSSLAHHFRPYTDWS